MLLSSRVYRTFRLLLVGALVIAALATGPALAQRNRLRSTGSEQCWVTPDPLDQMPYVYTVWGSGFAPGIIVNIFVQNALGAVILPGVAGADGTFGIASTATSAGTQEVYVRQARQGTDLANCSFVVN